jgi:hypothetical protein
VPPTASTWLSQGWLADFPEPVQRQRSPPSAEPSELFIFAAELWLGAFATASSLEVLLKSKSTVLYVRLQFTVTVHVIVTVDKQVKSALSSTTVAAMLSSVPRAHATCSLL